jgi:hypothetical protein
MPLSICYGTWGFHRAERTQMATTAGLDIRSISEEYFAAWEACDPDRIAAVTVDEEGLVSRKDTFVDVVQVNSLLAG